MIRALLFLAAFGLTSSILATDRAKVADMRSKLLLPDGTYLHVEVFTDCSNGQQKIGALLFSDEQVDLFATALDVRYGAFYGDRLRQTWTTKKKPEDPRLPTYIVVYNSSSGNALKSTTITKDGTEETTDSSPPVPTFEGNCGGSVHDPIGDSETS